LYYNSERNAAKSYDWIRQLRLQFLFPHLGRVFTGKSHTERRKIAIHRSRRTAALHSIVHLIPFGVALTLLVLHSTHYWISVTFTLSTTLQFVAKFHEILMQISILEIVLCIIRTEAIHGFVPLGALSGAVQVTQLSYLWSLDFASMFLSSSLRGYRRVLFCVAIPILSILTAVVGPSSAILMIPRPGSRWTYQTITRYANESAHTIYPSNFDMNSKLNL
jgi:hypothetical protein